jgi:hypothetical protein
MVIWTGLGFLVAIITFASLILTELLSERLTGDDAFYQDNPWLMLVAMSAAATLTYVLHRLLLRQKARTLVDKETGEELTLRPSNSLFFIPVKWWPLVLLISGILFTVLGYSEQSGEP